MIEAVNSVVLNAPLVRGGVKNELSQPSVQVEQISSGAVSAPQAPYISPFISVDYDYDRAVVLIRDSETGDTIRQFPSESRLQQIVRAETVSADRQAEVSTDVGGGDAQASPEVSEVSSSAQAVVSAEAQRASDALSGAAQAATQATTSAGVSFFA